MKKYRWTALLCASALVFSLAACGKDDADKIPPVESGHAAPVEAEAELADLLAMLTAADISDLVWNGPNTPTAEALAQLLAQAAAHTVQPEEDTYYGLWSADFHFDPWDADVLLMAGLQENVVRLTAEGFPDQALYLEDQGLYRMLRSANDLPREVEEEVYAKSKGLIDHYYDTLLENLSHLDGGFDRWVLHTLVPAAQREDLGAQAYQMTAALYAPTPEIAARQLAGGMYLDSQLRTFGMDPQSAYLVVLGDVPAGILPMNGGRGPEEVLDDYSDQADLKSDFWTAWGK